jgi:hypothetical protein
MTNGDLPRREITVDPVLAVAIAAAIFCCLFFHGYEVFQYTLSIDEELMLGGINPLQYIQLGRWGAFLLWWLRTPLPITPMVAGLALYSIAFVLLMRQFQIKNWESVVAASGIFFGFPVLLHAFAFSNLTLTIGLGTLVAVSALRVASVRSAARFVLAALLVALSVGLYQSFFYFVLVIFLADLARQIWLANDFVWKEQWRRFAWYGAIVASGLLLYGIIVGVLLTAFNQQLDYVPGYVRPETLAAHPLTILKISAHHALSLYSGAAATFVGFNRLYRLLALVCLAVLAWTAIVQWRKAKGASLLWVALLAAILAAPFVQHPINGGDMPLRTLVGLPAAAAVLVLFASEASPQLLRRWVILPLAVLVIVEFSAINNKQYYAGHWALERDKLLGGQIISRIEEMFPKETTYTIAVVGEGPVKNDALIRYVPSSTIGASFFQWDGGNPDRIAAFLNFLSSAKFSPASREQTERAFEAAEAMPSWPDHGSIARGDGVVIIKLSKPNALQLRLLCAGRNSEFCAKHTP